MTALRAVSTVSTRKRAIDTNGDLGEIAPIRGGVPAKARALFGRPRTCDFSVGPNGERGEGVPSRAIREKRARIIAEAEKAALRNVANLDWTMRQNIEDSFRRFELSLSNQLDVALKATRQAMQLVLQRRIARSEAIKVDIEQANRTVVELSDILAEVEALARPLTAQRSVREPHHVETIRAELFATSR